MNTAIEPKQSAKIARVSCCVFIKVIITNERMREYRDPPSIIKIYVCDGLYHSMLCNSCDSGGVFYGK